MKQTPLSLLVFRNPFLLSLLSGKLVYVQGIFKGQGDKITLGYFWKIQFNDFQPIFMPSNIPWVRTKKRTRTRQSHNFYTDVPITCNRLIYITHQNIIYTYSLFTTLPSILHTRKKLN